MESSQQHTGDSCVRLDTPDTVVSHEANYTLEGINLTFTEYIAYPVEHDDTLPGLFLIHDSSGLDDMEMYRSEEMAVRGYFVFAADLSGGEDILTEVFPDQRQYMLRTREGLQKLTEIAEEEDVSLIAIKADQSSFHFLLVWRAHRVLFAA